MVTQRIGEKHVEVLPEQASQKSEMTWVPVAPAVGVLRIDTTRTSVTYRVEELPAPDGRAFRFSKTDKAAGDPEGDDYTPFVGRVTRLDTCDCRGFIFGRGKPCKHVNAARALILNGWV
jgi:hypothetical protein